MNYCPGKFESLQSALLNNVLAAYVLWDKLKIE